jgi:CP family cyanate transporter-like MFS transporter
MTPHRNDFARFALLWLAGASLRLTILAVPPLILAIQNDLRLSATEVGILTGLPIAMFALAALPGSLLIARVGSQTALVCGLLIVAAGAALRGGTWNAAMLYAATIVMGAGVAIMQPTMPVLVREWLPSRIGFATAIYSNGLLVGEILAVWLTPLLMRALGDSWRLGLAIWSLPVLLTALAVRLFSPKPSGERPRTGNPLIWWPDWKNPLIWRLGLLFGCINAVYFASNAFLPAYLGSVGRGDLVQNALAALNFGQLPASFLIAAVAKKLERQAWPYAGAGCALTFSVAGLVFMPGAWTVFWAGLLGFSIATALILGLTLPALLAEPKDIGRTSAAMFTLSYAMGVAVAFLCGLVSDLTGGPGWAFAPIALCTVILSVSALGLRARGRLI